MIKVIGIAGAGQMGTAIAEVNLRAGHTILLYDNNNEQLTQSKNQIEKNIYGSNSKSVIEFNKSHKYINYSTDINILRDSDLIIECITEREEIKSKFYNKIEKILKHNAIIASNTSSISIKRLSEHLKKEENFIGIHFMNPPQIIKLVEIISHMKTSREVEEKVQEYITSLEMVSIKCQDQPGFVINRVLIPMINEAIYCLYNNVSDIDSIDTALKVGANHPMGPLQLADLIGLDTCLNILEILEKDLNNPKYKPCPLLKKYVNIGKLGRKTKEGFYKY
ncbi:MAG: 3-hydroxybutyryl-CoA dehydrogenase [Rhodobiaceae bacterium]|nr:3-hydroxybutyryl-CoA dehydrogenase [Rhodobiaceae bacterium]